MLQILKIENVALIDKATLDFERGLNVISGETGAGKSILLDSLSFVFGGRADKSLIRSNSKSMKVEAVFTSLNSNLINMIKDELSIDCNDELFLSRELDLNGKNICKINGELVPVATVKKVCQMMVDVHGQSEHLAILSNEYQLRIIDLYSKGVEELLSKLNEEIDEYKNVLQEIKLLGGNESEKQNLIDLYTYQINEIKNADIKENEYEELLLEKKEMQQYEKINTNLQQCLTETSTSGFSEPILDKISNCIHSLNSIHEINPIYQELNNRYDSVRIELQDICDTIQECVGKNIFDEERFNFVDERIDYIKSLFRKYGGNYEALNDYYQSIIQKLDNLINGAEKYQKLIEKQEKMLENIDILQEKISFIRKKSAKDLNLRLEQELKNLGMPNARMDIVFDRIDEKFSSTGYDRVEFMFCSNLGFELKPLNKVVSGGEMSRVMLAYKIVVSEVDDIQTIIFDEVDSGLSGNIAYVVAQYMARLSKVKQIIAVSHLPQICAMADYNIKVEKYSDNSTTHTQAIKLEDEKLYQEIARLMGAGDENAGIKIGQELKIKSNNYKANL